VFDSRYGKQPKATRSLTLPTLTVVSSKISTETAAALPTKLIVPSFCAFWTVYLSSI
jgi:hypothetical protein